MRKVLYVFSDHRRLKLKFDEMLQSFHERGLLLDKNYRHGKIVIKERNMITEYYLRVIQSDSELLNFSGMSVHEVSFDESSTFSGAVIQRLRTKERLND